MYINMFIFSVNSLCTSVFSVQPRECKNLHADFQFIYDLVLPLACLYTLLFALLDSFSSILDSRMLQISLRDRKGLFSVPP